jgi:hypothetical protein
MPEWLTQFPDIFFLDIKQPIDNAINYMLKN